MLDLGIMAFAHACLFSLDGLYLIGWHIYNFVRLVQIAMDNKEAILGSIPAEHKEEGSKLYTSLLEEKVIKQC